MSNPYESARMVEEYLFFHYATREETGGGLPVPAEAWGFATRVASELWPDGAEVGCALDVGCAVGGSSFELARHARRVVGLDFSGAFIEAAREMRDTGTMTVRVAEEGRRLRELVVRAPEDIDRSRVDFQTADATDLPEDTGSFDAVLAANLLCRLPDPRRFLDRLPELVKPGGILLLATPFSWLEEFTPPANWLGGHPDSRPSFEILSEILRPRFELETTKNLPFLIREHARKFQYGVSLGSRWRRR